MRNFSLEWQQWTNRCSVKQRIDKIPHAESKSTTFVRNVYYIYPSQQRSVGRWSSSRFPFFHGRTSNNRHTPTSTREREVTTKTTSVTSFVTNNNRRRRRLLSWGKFPPSFESIRAYTWLCVWGREGEWIFSHTISLWKAKVNAEVYTMQSYFAPEVVDGCNWLFNPGQREKASKLKAREQRIDHRHAIVSISPPGKATTRN